MAERTLLRAICLAFLRRTRVATTLRQLHVLLHRAGYGIASAYPVKTLADGPAATGLPVVPLSERDLVRVGSRRCARAVTDRVRR